MGETSSNTAAKVRGVVGPAIAGACSPETRAEDGASSPEPTMEGDADKEETTSGDRDTCLEGPSLGAAEESLTSWSAPEELEEREAMVKKGKREEIRAKPTITTTRRTG